MIYAKTNMEEMPKECKSCPSMVWRDEGNICGTTQNYVGGGNQTRPEWCPLTEHKEADNE